MKQRTQTKRKSHSEQTLTQPTQVAFMDHVRELQGRLFLVAVVFLLVAGAAYPFFDRLVDVIVAPLGGQNELVYLTPGGAFSFIIQVCMYVGIIGALPMIIYQLYRFIMPAVQRVTMRRAVGFTVASFLLAIVGIVFAYIVSLPAALYFLTSFDLYHINPMLTIDSYFSFVMTYLLAGALLFQLPLIMIMIDSIRPTPPKKLMGYQRHIIVGSFIVAAIISPTPDALNQILLASPVILMYQVGIVIVAWRHRKARAQARQAIADVPVRPSTLVVATQSKEATFRTVTARRPTTTSVPTRTIDGFVISRTQRSQPRKLIVAERAHLRAHQGTLRTPRSLDGLSILPRQ